MEIASGKGLHSSPFDLRQIFFTNLQLLGFDAAAAAKKWRILFNKDMFALPNKQGFEVVMYFLFSRLNLIRCRDEFRDCWPVGDKRQEQQFRKTCNNWLIEIAKDDPQARLPRIVASLFMSPGGDKFYRLLFDFSTYVITKVMQNEHGVRASSCLQMPKLNKQSSQFSEAMQRSVMCAAVRGRQNFLTHSESVIDAQNQWKIFFSEMIRDERSLNREVKELERKLKKEVEAHAESQVTRGSGAVNRRKSGVPGYDFDVQSVRRAERVREIRNLWKHLTEFNKMRQNEQEVVESILSGEQEKSQVDASEFNVRVPDLLLRECEKEIHRRHVDNIYQGGKLNVLSLVRLWNLSLHLYIEKMHQVGAPKFVEAEPMIRTHVHTHQAHLTNTEALRRQLGKVMLPDLKESIARLKKELDSMSLTHSPSSVRSTLLLLTPQQLKIYHQLPETPRRTLGLGLLPPTPPVNFNYDDANLHPDPVSQHMPHTQDVPHQVSTPEAASQMMDLIHQRARTQLPSGLVQGSPLFAPRLANRGQPSGVNFVPTKIPKRGEAKPRSKLESEVAQGGDLLIDDQENVEPAQSRQSQKKSVATAGRTDQVQQRNKPTAGHPRKSDFKEPQAVGHKTRTRQVSNDGKQMKRHVSKNSKLSEEYLQPSPKRDRSRNISADMSPHIALGEDAFTSHDKLARTPMTEKPRHGNPASWTEKLTNDSIGPLSSTRIEHHSKTRPQDADKLVMKLFSDETSEDGTLKEGEVGESFSSHPLTSISGVASLDSTLKNDAPSRSDITEQQAEQLVDRILSLSDMCEQDGSLTDVSGNLGQDTPSRQHRTSASRNSIDANVQKLTSDIAHDLLKWGEEPMEPFSMGSHFHDILNTDDILRDLEATLTPTLPTRTTTLRETSQKSSPHRTKRVLVTKGGGERPELAQNVATFEANQLDSSLQPVGRLGTYGQEKEKSPTLVDEPGEVLGHHIYQNDSSHLEDVLDLDEVDDELNTSARVIEVQNGNYSETIEVSPPRPKLSRTSVTNTPSVSNQTDTSQTEGPSKVVPDIDAIMKRYRRLKQQGFLSSEDTNGGDDAICKSESPLVHSSEPPSSPVIGQEYLTRTPVKETRKKFTLSFDDDVEVNTAPAMTTVHDVFSPPYIMSDESLLDSVTPPFTPTRKHEGATITSLQSVPLSPLTDALHQDRSAAHNFRSLLDEDESILLPASPPSRPFQTLPNIRNSPAVGQLLDI